MTKEEYKQELFRINTDYDKTVFIQKYYFDGSPYIFWERDGEYYHFKKRIADNFEIEYTNINIVGSARFGFSPYKFTDFTFDSDIDVAIYNESLFDKFFDLISDYAYLIKSRVILLRKNQYNQYIKFIKYFSTGWMRPDLLPVNTTEFKRLREEWDDFFKSISYGNSEVGNYKVKAGLFKSQYYAEKYYKYSVEQLIKRLKG